MDLQDVANLTIPEGSVKTIYNKDNRLLWGAVGYDTKYTGDTTQNGEPTPDAPVAINVVTGEQSVWVHGKNLWKFNSTYSNSSGNTWVVPIDDFYLKAGTYTFSWNATSSNGVRISYQYADGETHSKTVTNTGASTWTVTFTEDVYQLGMRLTNSITISNIQLESGSATAYEPYQGATYTIDLGNTEFCKIGTYQDKIYTDGTDWYVHKEISKVVFDGSEEWSNNSTRYFWTSVSDALLFEDGDSNSPIMSNYYPVATATAIYGRQVAYGIALDLSVAGKIRLRNSSFGSDVASLQTWLSTNNTTVCYALAIPTDTKITDDTLISQLNAVHEWLTRYGYNATVSGNLPIIIDRTNL